jgi:hypothetical protein
VTYGGQLGQYTKIGNLVTVSASIDLTSKGTGGVGRPEIAGLPFTVGGASNSRPGAAMFWILYAFSAGNTMLYGFPSGATTKITMYECGNNTTWTDAAWANVNNSSTFRFYGSYFV